MLICFIILNFSISKNWTVHNQKESGGIVDIEWWCDEVMDILISYLNPTFIYYFLFQLLILGCFDGTLIICQEKGQQSVVNTKMNPFYFKLCSSYNSDNFVVVDFETVESFNCSQVNKFNLKRKNKYVYIIHFTSQI